MAQPNPASDVSWALVTSRGADSLGVVQAKTAVEAAERARSELAERGYVYARVDSISANHRIHLTPGRRTEVQSVELIGVAALDGLAEGWQTRKGVLYDPRVLRSDLGAAAERYVEAGFPDAELVPTLTIDTTGVAIRVDVTEGSRAVLAGVELVGGRSRSRGLATRLSGLRVGSAYQPFDRDALRRELEATGLFIGVGEPRLVLDANRQLVVQVPVQDAPPGTFDLVLGYLPSANGTSGGLVGSGRLELRNPFGGGRRVAVSLNRTPGLVSAFDLSLADPFVAGLPFGLAGTFSGYARDSTFSRQRLRAETTLRVSRGVEVALSAAREAVAPGAFGAGLVEGQQRVVRSSGWFFGAGLAVRLVDAPLNPRRGLVLSVTAEQGRRRRTPDPVVDAASSQLQRRMDLQVRGYAPTLSRQTVVIGVEGQVILSGQEVGQAESITEGELLRLGGATSLRGYDEDAFLGDLVGRMLLEYRFLLGPQTYAFGFGDLGYIDQPPLPGQLAERQTRPGYGAGIQVRTGLGLATVTYALNPDLPASRGKVHVGLSVGL
ncbi:MAG: BamA/TamA family outer membrane protein [Rubricoccaceae bacterium]